MQTTRQTVPTESVLTAPVTQREMLLTTAASVLLALVAEDFVVTAAGVVTATTSLAVATWMAYRAEEERKQRLSAQDRDEEQTNDQW